MGDIISMLNTNTDDKLREDIRVLYGDLWNDQRGRPAKGSDLSDEGALATVLMDTDVDTSFLIQPNQHPNMKLDLLPNPKVMKEIKRQLETFGANKGNEPELWMYFDSGASRSVISTTSPVRKHLHSVTPTYGSCSVGNGTPLQYIEKGTIKDKLEITVVEDLKYDLFSSVSTSE
jgi:hypothetical protein